MLPKRSPIKWISVAGSDVLASVQRSEPLDVLVENCQAVYIWQRNLRPPPRILSNPVALYEWLDRAVTLPYARINSVSLTHYITLDSLTIGGGELTEAKILTLRRLLANASGRDLAARFVASLAQYVPPLYVGETGDLQTRIRQHLAGDSQFAQWLQNKMLISWEEVDLHYFRVGPPLPPGEDTPNSKEVRTLLEFLTTRLTLAGGVARPG